MDSSISPSQPSIQRDDRGDLDNRKEHSHVTDAVSMAMWHEFAQTLSRPKCQSNRRLHLNRKHIRILGRNNHRSNQQLPFLCLCLQRK